MNKIIIKFKTVSPEKCETTEIIYFIEQERKPMRGQRRELSLFEDYCGGDIENSIENLKKI